MNREKYQKQITDYLMWLVLKVKQNNSINLTDINTTAEYFYCGLLNLIFGYNLVNINIIEKNAAAIDLVDHERKIAIQVTSTASIEKVKYTVEKFIEKKLHKSYQKLIILNISEKKQYKYQTIGDEYKLDTKNDIWDVKHLINEINSKTDTSDQKKILDYLIKELRYLQPSTLPKEVSTILGIIEHISDENHPAVGNGYMEEPFPEDKFYVRFSDHSAFLEQRYQDLFKEYGGVLKAVKENSDFGSVKLRRAADFLRGYSDKILFICHGNPKLALERIIDDFSKSLCSNGYDFCAGAAEFYIIEQLTKCNVFPNKGN